MEKRDVWYWAVQPVLLAVLLLAAGLCLQTIVHGDVPVRADEVPARVAEIVQERIGTEKLLCQYELEDGARAVVRKTEERSGLLLVTGQMEQAEPVAFLAVLKPLAGGWYLYDGRSAMTWRSGSDWEDGIYTYGKHFFSVYAIRWHDGGVYEVTHVTDWKKLFSEICEMLSVVLFCTMLRWKRVKHQTAAQIIVLALWLVMIVFGLIGLSLSDPF